MEVKDLQTVFEERVAQGSTIGNNTSYVDINPMPTSGEDEILPTTLDTIKIEPSRQSTNLVISYLTRNGRWISKNSLFGRHYLAQANPAAKIVDMQCRTKFGAQVSHKILDFTVKDRDGNAKPVSVYCFTAPTKVVFSKTENPVYVPAQENAWDKANKTMKVTREMKDYALLSVG